MTSFLDAYTKEGLGRTVGAIGGALGISSLRDLGGQMTGGQRTYNQVPAFRAYSTPTPTPVQTTGGGVADTGTNNVLGAQTTGGAPAPAPEPQQVAGDGQGDMQAQLQSELDNIFSPVFAALSGQENQVGAEYSAAQQDIQGQYGLSKESLASEKETGEQQLGQQEVEAGGRKEDALTSATRLYNELTRGGQQRFGGASSAGEAFQSLTAVEQQRRQGTIMQGFETAMQKIGTYKADLQKRFDLAGKELEVQKNEAMRQATVEHGRAMQEIRNNRAMAESDKARATMETLQDLRNKVYAINLQDLQFKQTLALNKSQSEQYVNDYTQQIIQSVTGASNVVAGTDYSGARQTAYGINAPQGAGSQQMIGQVSRKDEDLA